MPTAVKYGILTTGPLGKFLVFVNSVFISVAQDLMGVLLWCMGHFWRKGRSSPHLAMRGSEPLECCMQDLGWDAQRAGGKAPNTNLTHVAILFLLILTREASQVTLSCWLRPTPRDPAHSFTWRFWDSTSP